MIAYLVNQIASGILTYTEVVTRRPDLKGRIDNYIEEKHLLIDKSL